VTYKLKINNIAFLMLMIFCACSSDNKPAAEYDAAKTPDADKESTGKKKNIVFFGNSITAGYGLQLSEAFPALIQHKIDSLQLPYTAINAGVSGETSADGVARIDWILRQPVDIFVLELGGNDGLRGIPVSETKKNLQLIMDKVKAKNPTCQIVLAGMQIPPNMGKRYTDEFRNMYPELAKKNDVRLIPFLLEGVGGEARLNLEDGIHPTAEGHTILAQNVWSVLEPML
jgi:acyl-CoA thioesterase-1